MAIQYDFYQSPYTMGTQRKRYHARPVHFLNVSGEALVKEICNRGSLHTAEVKAVLTALNETLIDFLSKGYQVQVPGVGGFHISLSCTETRRPSDTRSKSIKVKNVTVRPEKDLVKQVASKATFVRTRWKVHSEEKQTLNDLIVLVKDFMSKNPYLRRADLERIGKLTRSTAINRLHELVEQGYLENASTDKHHPIYVWCKDKGRS